MSKQKKAKLEDYGVLIYKVVSGSHSYGTNIEGSDTDVRGIFIPHKPFLYGTQKIEVFEDPNGDDDVYYSLQKFLMLALECNPNIVELLKVEEEHVLYMSEEGKQLREMADMFFTKNAFKTFGSYAYAQIKKLLAKDKNDHQGVRKHLLDEHGIDTKAFMHFERLTDMGIEILETGTSSTYRPNHKDLLTIRNGHFPDGTKITIETAKERAQEKERQLERALRASTIHDVPDFDLVNEWAINVTNKRINPQSDTCRGIMKPGQLKILPIEYEMVDQATLYLVSNPLVRRKSNSQAQGFCIPHKDWFIGLRQFSEFKFKDTTIEDIHKFVRQVKACNPRHIDVLYANKENVLHSHPAADKLLEKLKTLPTAKAAYYKAKGYIDGNLKKMMHWETLKEQHEALIDRKKQAHALTEEDWEEKLLLVETEVKDKALLRSEKKKLIKEYKEWQELISLPKLRPVPDIPKNTSTDSASMMGKFGYDTLLASELVHVARMFIELLQTGNIQDSRAYEAEMYSIKHGSIKSFDEFKLFTEDLLNALEEAKADSPLTGNNHQPFDAWLIEFIERHLDTLN